MYKYLLLVILFTGCSHAGSPYETSLTPHMPVVSTPHPCGCVPLVVPTMAPTPVPTDSPSPTAMLHLEFT